MDDLKDHQIAEVVNTLRDIAVEFHSAQQLRERIAHVIVPLLSHRAVPQANAEQDARPFLQTEDLNSLKRFFDCCEDFDSGGHDVSKESMTRLRELGVIQSKGFGRDQITAFGDFVLCLETNTPCRLPLKTYAEYNADSKAAHEAKLSELAASKTTPSSGEGGNG